jgi:major vault protein
MSYNIVKIEPYHYIHVMDGNTNITRLETGPQTFVLQDHERITSGKNTKEMIRLNPFTFVEIENPVIRDETNELVIDKHGQVKVMTGDSSYRTWVDYKEPFPLYPQEVQGDIQDIKTIPRDCSARMVAVRDFDDEGNLRHAGDEWLIEGPKTYMPRIEVSLDKVLRPEIILTNTALRIRARRACKDHKGKERKDGEEWLVRDKGFYIPRIDEDIDEKCHGNTITEIIAIHLKASQTFKDVYGIERIAGRQWLIKTN